MTFFAWPKQREEGGKQIRTGTKCVFVLRRKIQKDTCRITWFTCKQYFPKRPEKYFCFFWAGLLPSSRLISLPLNSLYGIWNDYFKKKRTQMYNQSPQMHGRTFGGVRSNLFIIIIIVIIIFKDCCCQPFTVPVFISWVKRQKKKTNKAMPISILCFTRSYGVFFFCQKKREKMLLW